MLTTPLLLALSAVAGSTDIDDVPSFSKPIQLRGGGELIKTEAPGYASPAWYDVNGDGRMDLVVGQFAGGKLRVYHGQEDGELAAGEWLQAGGETAEVPGVW